MGILTMNKVGFFLAVFLLLNSIACQNREPIRIGYMGGLTGRNGDLGIAGRDGALLAVDAVNAAGGINGRRIELLPRDDKSDPEEAKKHVSELISKKVVAIVGPMTSAMAVASIPLANEARVLLISPSVSSNDFSGIDDYFIRLNLNRDTATASAEHLAGPLKSKTAALIYDISNKAYTASVADVFKSRFVALGGRIVSEQTFNGKEHGSLLTLAKASVSRKPQSVLIVAGAVDSAMICQQLSKLGFPGSVFIVEWAGTNEFLKAGGRSVSGTLIAQHFNAESTAATYERFKAEYLKRFGDAPSFAATYAYEAVMILVEAIRENPDTSHVKETIIGMGKFAGLQGDISVDTFGDPQRTFFLMKVRDGKFVLAE